MIAFSIGLALGSSVERCQLKAMTTTKWVEHTRSDEFDLLVRQILEPPPSFIDRYTHRSAILLEVFGGKICQGPDFTDGCRWLFEELP